MRKDFILIFYWLQINLYVRKDEKLINLFTFFRQEALNGYTEQHVDKANPEDFIHLFLNNSERLVEFLEHLVKSDTRSL